TSACSSAEIEPVTRRYRSIGWLWMVAARTATGAGSLGEAALVCSPLHAAEKSAVTTTAVSRGAWKLRIMTRVLTTVVSRRRSSRSRVCRGIGGDVLVARIERKLKVAPRAGLEAAQRGVDGRARQRVAVLARREPIAQAERRRAVRGGEQQAENGMRRRALGARPGIDRLLDAPDHVVLHLAHEAEAIPVIADPR